jgi:hypothetical protein
MGKVETIFDYNLTESELKRFNLTSPELIEMAKEFDSRPDTKSNDSRLYALGLLFSMRGNDKKANEYWSKIENKDILSTLVQDF